MSKEAMTKALEAITTYLSESPDPSEEAVEGLCDARALLRQALTDHTEQHLGMVKEQHKPYRPLQDNGSKYFGAWDKAEQALNRMAENARELGLDYEPAQEQTMYLESIGPGYGPAPQQKLIVRHVNEPEQPAQEPAPLRDAIVANLVREGINKHRARELADHFVSLTNAQPVVPDALRIADKESADYHEGWNDCRAAMLEMRKP